MTVDHMIFRREKKFTPLELRGVSETGWFSGYASLFDEVDLGRDRVEKGAFQRCLDRRGPSGIRMLFQHDPSQPIGAWQTIREDGRGLYVEGLLSTGASRAREVHSLMKSGALDGLSIGFQTLRSKADAKGGIRRIIEADLWEISVVTFPMLPSARISEVKAEAFASETQLAAVIARAASRIRRSIA